MAKILVHLSQPNQFPMAPPAGSDFGLPKFGCLQLKVRDEKNLPVLKMTSGST